MAGISSIGVGSGLPLDTLLADIRKVENLPLQLLAQRKESAQSRLSGYGILKSGLDNLQTQAQKLSTPNALLQLKAHSSHDGIKIKVDSTAIAGQYRLEVLQAARAQELVSQTGFEKSNSVLTEVDTTLTLQREDGSTGTMEIKAGTTLTQLIEQINAQPDLGLAATLINDGSDQPHRLMLRSLHTGTEAALQSLQFSDSQLHDRLGFDAGTGNTGNYQVQDALNAHLKINGIEVHSPTNQISSVIAGVDIDIAAHQSYEQPVNITISRDNEGSAKLIQGLVKNFNNLLDSIDKQTHYDIESNTASPLMGDSIARRIKSRLSSALHFSLPDGQLRTLTQIGIETDHTTGRLKLNEDKLNSALQSDPQAVDRLFSGPEGFAQHIVEISQPFLANAGFFDIATESINREIRGIERQYEATQYRIDMTMANYQRQFQQLDVLVSQMHQTSNYLEQQLSMLVNLNREK